MPRLLLIVAPLFFLSAFASAQSIIAADSPHIRGPNFDGHSPQTGLIDTWPGSGPPVLWTRELGPGYSGFVAADGRAFTLDQTASSMFLIALDLDTGKELWKQRVDWSWQSGGMYPGPYASPTHHNGNIYYATPLGNVGCLDAQTGRSRWTVNVREKFGSRGTDFGYAATPTIDAGRLFLPVGGPNAAMVALNPEDGSTLWASGDDPASYCPAYPITLDGRRLVVGYFQNVVALFDAKTGTRLWREVISNSYDEHSSWPLFDGRHLLIASPFRNGSQLFRFESPSTRSDDKNDAGIANDTGTANDRTPNDVNSRDQPITAKTVWSGKQLSNDVCSSLLHDGFVYGFDIHQLQASVHRPARGTFKCLEFLTGKVRWETKEVGQSSVLFADGKLILWTESGELILARPNPERYEPLARSKILAGPTGDGGMCWAMPCLADKRLIVRDHEKAVCLYLGPPTDLDPQRETQTITANPGFDWSQFVPKEPEYPNDAPLARDVARWFAWNLAIFAVAAAAVPLHWLVPRLSARILFASAAIALGAVGTTAIGAWFDTFVWTWPVSLYVTFRALIALASGKRPPTPNANVAEVARLPTNTNSATTPATSNSKVAEVARLPTNANSATTPPMPNSKVAEVARLPTNTNSATTPPTPNTNVAEVARLPTNANSVTTPPTPNSKVAEVARLPTNTNPATTPPMPNSKVAEVARLPTNASKIARNRLPASSYRQQILPRLALLLFAALCYGYYQFCMAVGYAMAWTFLCGFLPAAPLAIVAQRTSLKPSSDFASRTKRVAFLAGSLLLEAAAFAVYFWTSAFIPACKAVWSR